MKTYRNTIMSKSTSSKDNLQEKLDKLILDNKKINKENEQLHISLGKCIVLREYWKAAFTKQTRLYKKLERENDKLKRNKLLSGSKIDNYEKIDLFDYIERARIFSHYRLNNKQISKVAHEKVWNEIILFLKCCPDIKKNLRTDTGKYNFHHRIVWMVIYNLRQSGFYEFEPEQISSVLEPYDENASYNLAKAMYQSGYELYVIQKRKSIELAVNDAKEKFAMYWHSK